MYLFNDEPTLETIGFTVHIECAQTFIYFDLKQLQHMRVITTLGTVYMSLASLVIRLCKWSVSRINYFLGRKMRLH